MDGTEFTQMLSAGCTVETFLSVMLATSGRILFAFVIMIRKLIYIVDVGIYVMTSVLASLSFSVHTVPKEYALDTVFNIVYYYNMDK